MSYLVLARKLRPQTFDEIASQQHITDTLRKAITSGRISHAYLFCGTRGTGKTTTARVLAKALNCEKGPTAEPCLQCVNCKEIATSSSMDVIEIDAASNTGVDSIRDLRENVRYAPAGSRYKIYIIDEVHRLSGAAFDALLKTLEEPPAHVVFIFATTEPHSLPATILSRTQRYDFRRIPLADLIDSLTTAAQKENIRISDDALALIARKGDGSLRDALSIFEQALAYADDGITVELITSALGLVDFGTFFELTEAIYKRDLQSVLGFVDKLTESGADIGQFLGDFQTHLRNLLVTRSVPQPSRFLELSDQQVEMCHMQKDYFSESDLLRMSQAVSQLMQQLKDGAEPRTFLELTLLKLATADTTATLQQVLTKLSALTTQSKSAVVAPAVDLFSAKPAEPSPPSEKKTPVSNPETKTLTEAEAAQIVPNPTIDSTSPRSATWEGFLESYNHVNGLLSTMLRKGKAKFTGENTLQLIFPPDVGISAVLTADKLKQLENAMESHFSKPLRLKIETDKNMKATRSRTSLDPRFDVTPEDLLAQNPDIKDIVDRYDGKILSIKKVNSRGAGDG
jgi:DNA polymerase-3 subunit gamma/tau